MKNQKRFSMAKAILALCLVTLSFNASADAISDAFKVQDYDTVFKLMLKKAESGKADAQHNVCIFYLQGMGTQIDDQKALDWCSKSAAQGSASSEATLGDIYTNKNEFKEAFKWYSLAAKHGELKGQLGLGFLYRDGNGVAKDADKAVAWFTKAAAQEGPHVIVGLAYKELAVMYLNGDGVKTDAAIAISYAEKGAVKGNPDCQYYLGFAYLNGYGGKAVDKKLARNWLTNAANAGQSNATELLKSM